MIIVLTGQPRHGKSQYAIKLLLDYIKDNTKRLEQGKLPRDIYCNIAGINDKDVKTKLPEVLNQDIVFKDKKLWFGEHKDCPEGYFCPQRGSIFIYDECHKVDWIKEKSGTLSNDLTCISMNEHGHEDYIFILITQFPQYIHTHLRGLVEYHYHSKRFFGSKGSKIYKWNEFQLNPRSDKALKDAFETDKFHFKKKYQDCYKSASAHDSIKIKIPAPLLYATALIIGLFAMAFYKYSNSYLKTMIDNQKTPQTQTQEQPEPTQSPTTPQSPTHQQPTEQGEQSLKADEEQRTRQLENRRYYLYTQDLPEDYTIRREDPNLQVRGVMQMGNTCKAYNAYGDVMTLTAKQCKEYINTGRVLRAHTQKSPIERPYAPQNHQTISNHHPTQNTPTEASYDPLNAIIAHEQEYIFRQPEQNTPENSP